MTYAPALAPIEYRLQAAIDQVQDQDGVTISVTAKKKTLLKFGRHTTLGTTAAMIWNYGALAPTETLPTTNAITHIVSSSAADVGITVNVEYHTISGANLTFGVQPVTLNGQTPVALTVPCARTSRINNTSATNLAGTVVTYESSGATVTAGVVTPPTLVHAAVTAATTFPGTGQQTRKGATSISQFDYFLVTMWHGHMLGSTNSRADLQLQKRSTTGVWLPTGVDMGLSVSGTTGSPTQLDPVVPIANNHDIRVMGQATSSNTDVSVYIGGYLASIVA